MQCPHSSHPVNPLTALSAADGSAQCRRVLAGPAFRFDAGLQAWVASGQAMVRTVLSSPLCRIRPPDAPIPPALAGRQLGAWFARLLRQRDDAWHAEHKPALAAALATVDTSIVADLAQRLAGPPPGSAAALDELVLALPLSVLAGLLGLDDGALPSRGRQLDELLAALLPDVPAAQRDAGEQALGKLLAWVSSSRATPLALALRRALPDADARAANVLGLLLQTREATAALLALALHTLASDDACYRGLRQLPGDIDRTLRRLQTEAAPVQLTRRYVACDGDLGGQPVRRGDAVLVWLATANLDAGSHEDGYGFGAHRCPGEAIARQLAHGVMRAALAWPAPWRKLAAQAALRHSHNARWYRFAWEGERA